MRPGICKLCLLKKDLVESHLLPKAGFAQLRGSVPGDENPIFVSARGTKPVILQTSKQVHDCLLCMDCEQILQKGGEDWILQRLAVGVASPLYYALGGLEPVYDQPNFKVYPVAGNPEFDVDKIAHFALGVFFKAGVYTWTVGKNKMKLQLGQYLEPLRMFLLGKAAFPENCVLMLCIHPPTNAPKRLSMPYEWSRGTCRTHGFVLVGLEFVLSLGKQIPEWQRGLCFVNSASRKVIVTNHTEEGMTNNIKELLRKGMVRGKLKGKIHRYNQP